MPFDLAIVIVSYNTREMLRACLRALPAATAGLSTEAWVVDNASRDESVQMVRSEYPHVRVIANAENLGFARANNQALGQCDARYLLLLNPDTEAEPGSLAALAGYMDAHPETGACGPMLLNSDGSLQPNGGRLPTPRREMLTVLGLGRLAPPHGRDNFDAPARVDQISGACLMARAQAVARVGLLDERFFMFYEEVDWCLRMAAAGWQVHYVPEARVVHHWMGSVSQSGKRMSAHFYRSQRLYFEKHHGRAAAAAAVAAGGIGRARSAVLHAGAAVKGALRRRLSNGGTR